MGKEKDEAQIFRICLGVYVLLQRVTELTRVAGADTPSILDLIFMHNNLEIDIVSHGLPLGKRDPAIVKFEDVVK